MKCTVEMSKPALKQLADIKESRVREQLFKRIEGLANDPGRQGKALKDDLAGLRSVRAVGQRYRIIYQIEAERVVVVVVAVGIRKEGDRADIYRQAALLVRFSSPN